MLSMSVCLSRQRRRRKLRGRLRSVWQYNLAANYNHDDSDAHYDDHDNDHDNYVRSWKRRSHVDLHRYSAWMLQRPNGRDWGLPSILEAA